jgi:translation initiation factor IF-2
MATDKESGRKRTVTLKTGATRARSSGVTLRRGSERETPKDVAKDGSVTAARLDGIDLTGRGSSAAPTAPAPRSSQSGEHLTSAERDKRLAVLEAARRQSEGGEAPASERESEVARQRQARLEAEASRQQAREAAEREREARAEAARQAEAEAEARAAREAEAARLSSRKPAPKKSGDDGERGEESDFLAGGRLKRSKPQPNRNTTKPREESRRRSGKISISDALADDDERRRSLASMRRSREREKQRAREGLDKNQRIVRDVTVPETITLRELANRMAERQADVTRALMKMGVMATASQTIDADTAELIVEEFGHRIVRVAEADVETALLATPEDSSEDLKPRPPVITIMGHVDHGKTSILDHFRKSDVVAGEAGGITQHIGAYQITTASGQRLSFLDTPGHAAFTEMRKRGSNVTDIVVLVVAADDGIMPQTIEALNHARAAGVPLIVAINKIDASGANPTKIEQDLLNHEVQVESMGGETQSIAVSALTGQGMSELEEAILLQAELLELQANPDAEASGSVVEAKVEKGRGAVATVLVKRGTLRVGDIVVAGQHWGKVRALLDDRQQRLKTALPAQPVEILGLDGAPLAGDPFIVVQSNVQAREVTAYRVAREKEMKAAAQRRTTVDRMFSDIQEGGLETLPIVLKTDVQGSAEAIASALEKLSTDEVQVKILHSAVGAISEGDVTLAAASEALILAFDVRANAQARETAKQQGIDIRYYSVIYEIIDDVKALLSGLLAPEQRETFLGYASILEVFDITKVGKVAGCKVTEGVVRRGAGVRLLRDSVVIHSGKLKTLRRFKDEVREVQNGYECGMAFESYEDLKPGDQIECFEVTEVARTL